MKIVLQKLPFCFFLFLFLSLLLFHILGFSFVRIIGESMEPSFAEGDILLCRASKPAKNDIVVFSLTKEQMDLTSSHEVLIKRITATKGDLVQLRDGKLYINGQFSAAKNYDKGYQEKDETLESGEYIVLGDNRSHSLDSRYFWKINEKQIQKKVLFRIFPLFNNKK